MTITIQQAIDTIIAAVPGAPFPDTVDSVKLGDPSKPITGIATTFLANCDVIEQAVQLNANLIICHEPLFYNHRDNTDWLHDDPVYQAKRHLIETHGLVVWRFHDYLHSLQPDPVLMGLIEALSWKAYFQPETELCQIPPLRLKDLVSVVKAKLHIQTLRAIGNLDMECKTIALLPGFPSAEKQMTVLGQSGVDVVLCGEIHEWETSEYARDAVHVGRDKALIVVGHAASEEPGMMAIIPWLEERLPDVPIQFVPTENAFQYL